jgi:alpha-tubulin suppressor-like RCC1 family protein
MYESPELMISLLNTNILQISANSRFTLILTKKGNVYSMGFDMRKLNKT